MSSFSLKIVAVICMLLDHTAYLFHADLPDWLYITMRLAGRLAMPVFCFLIAEGFLHTRNVRRYLLRLLAFALISEIPFDLAFAGRLWDWGDQNVFCTLFLGLLAIAAFDRFLGMGHSWAALAVPLLCALTAYLIHSDYGPFGVFFVFIFYACRRNTRLMIAAFAAGVLALSVYSLAHQGTALFSKILLMHMGAVALILRYNGKPGGPVLPPPKDSAKTSKPVASLVLQIGFYAFYPAHLLILRVIREWF